MSLESCLNYPEKSACKTSYAIVINTFDAGKYFSGVLTTGVWVSTLSLWHMFNVPYLGGNINEVS